MVGEVKVICMRIESTMACRTGGWYHSLAGAVPHVYNKPAPAPAPTLPHLDALLLKWWRFTKPSQLSQLSATLGVSIAALEELNACWAAEHNAWAFPMRNEKGETVGIRLRSVGGVKWAVTGSKQGLFSPASLAPQSPLYVCEGPTSLAALLTVGLPAVGRASCQTGVEMLRAYCQANNIYRVIIIGDNDRKTKADGSPFNPGNEGAQALAKRIGIRHVVWTLPHTDKIKDVRDYIRAGATRQVIESKVKDLLWQR